MYQATRSAITKRQPTLIKALKKYNTYCAEFDALKPADCHIPSPLPLPVQLSALRNDPSLYEDVWILPNSGRPPRWLEDEDVRVGIRSLHVLDRCREEIQRLELERQNLRRWLDEETRVIRRLLQECTGQFLVYGFKSAEIREIPSFNYTCMNATNILLRCGPPGLED